MKNFAKMKTIHLSIITQLIALGIILLLITGCSNDESESAHLYLNNPVSQTKQKVSARADDTEFDQFLLTVETLDGEVLSEVDAFQEEQTIRFKIPTNTPLFVKGNAFLGERLLFQGEVFVEPIKAGRSAKVTLLLYSPTDVSVPIQINIGNGEEIFSGRNKGIAFSKDGSFVLFSQQETVFLSEEISQKNYLYLKNIATGEITSLHTNSAGDKTTTLNSNGDINADISADGVYVTFSSDDTALVPNNLDNVWDIYLKNTITSQIQRISVRDNDTTEKADSILPQISDDGSIISFYSYDDLVPPFSDGIFIYDRLSDSLDFLDSDASEKYALSGDGKVIAYQTKNKAGLELKSLAFADDRINVDEFNIGDSIELSSSERLGLVQISSSKKVISDAAIDFRFNISKNGRYVIFIPQEDSASLLKGQIYLYDSVTEQTTLISKNRNNQNFAGAVSEEVVPAISNDGRYIAFAYDGIVYVRDLQFNNLVEVVNGTSPFISEDGIKIGYKVLTDDNEAFSEQLFAINNPLYYSPTTVFAKPVNPGGLSLTEDGNQIILSWNAEPTANYYRVYRSTSPNVATQLNDNSTALVLTDTSATSINFTNPNIGLEGEIIASNSFYFIVVSVNENGESPASLEESLITESNFLQISSPQQNATTLSLTSPIDIFFSKPVDVSTILSSISISEINGNGSLLFTTSESPDQVSIFLDRDFKRNTRYRVTINQSLIAQDDTILINDTDINFTTARFVSEGRVGAPVDVSGTYFTGGIDALKGDGITGQSFYLAETPFSTDYLIRSYPAIGTNIKFSASRFGFLSQLDGVAECNDIVNACTLFAGNSSLLHINVSNSGSVAREFNIEFGRQLVIDNLSQQFFELDFIDDDQIDFVTLSNLGANIPYIIRGSASNRAGTLIVELANEPDSRCEIISNDVNSTCKFMSSVDGTLFLRTQNNATNPNSNIDAVYQYTFEPGLVVSSPQANTASVQLTDIIELNFTKAVDGQTLKSTIKFTDAQNQTVKFNVNMDQTGTLASVIPLVNLNRNQSYTILVDEILQSIDGDSLETNYQFSFTTVNNASEGTFDSPATISTTAYIGSIGASLGIEGPPGASYYTLTVPANTDYIIHLPASNEPDIAFSASRFDFPDKIGEDIKCFDLQTDCQLNTNGSNLLYIKVTNNGPAAREFEIEIAKLTRIDFAVSQSFDLFFQADDQIDYIEITNLSPDIPFVINPIVNPVTAGSMTVEQVDSGVGKKGVCRLESDNANSICEFRANTIGALFLRTQNNIEDPNLMMDFPQSYAINPVVTPGQAFIIATVGETQYFTLPIIDTTSLISAELFAQNTVSTVEVFNDNWSQRICDISVSSISSNIDECVLQVSPEKRINLRIIGLYSDFAVGIAPTINVFIRNAGLDTPIVLSATPTDYLWSGSGSYTEVSVPQPNTFYRIVLDAPVFTGTRLKTFRAADNNPANVPWGQSQCVSPSNANFQKSCEAKSDVNGKIYIGFTFAEDNPTTFSATATPILIDAVVPATTNKAISPVKYFFGTEFDPSARYQMSITNILPLFTTGDAFNQIAYELYSEQWSNPFCQSPLSSKPLPCIIEPSILNANNEFYLRVLDNSFTDGTVSDVSVDIAMKKIVPINLFTNRYIIDGIITDENYMVHVIDQAPTGDDIQVSLSLINSAFTVYSDASLKTQLCSSLAGSGANCTINSSTANTLYIVIDVSNETNKPAYEVLLETLLLNV